MTDPSLPKVPEDSLATQPLPVGLPPTPTPPPPPLPAVPPPPPQATTTQSIKFRAPLPEDRPGEPVHRPRKRFWALGILAVVILGGSVAYFALAPSGVTTPQETRAETAPAAVRPYLDRAAQGDSAAMRMLGTMYYNGLNVPQDRREGVKWYRKAAAAGNVAARRDLEQLGLPVDEKK
jgi:hypothetical protein